MTDWTEAFPRPWGANRSYSGVITDANGSVVSVISTPLAVDADTRVATAAYIAIAVNAHAALVTAAEVALAALDDIKDEPLTFKSQYDAVTGAVATLDSVLAMLKDPAP